MPKALVKHNSGTVSDGVSEPDGSDQMNGLVPSWMINMMILLGGIDKVGQLGGRGLSLSSILFCRLPGSCVLASCLLRGLLHMFLLQ